ncbi:MAG TPA: sensor histidine kinase [Pseudonocardiaceae bacterium]|nr:sensor histidine kinase [Pseudonocardiaceae bacterium]
MTDSGRRIVATPYALAAAGVLLALLAVADTELRLRDQLDPRFRLVALLFAVCTAVPVVLPRPVPAAVLVTPASVLSLTLFHDLPVVGLVAQLVVLFRVGRSGAQLLAVALALPFLVLVLVEPGVDRVLLASLGPATALAGIALRARSEASVHRSARQAAAGTLVEYTARGERARIARELHDVVAHHISMIAVQAETARLTVPGMPAAGAQRLSEIGDTARAGLTEMRRLLGVLREDADVGAERRPQPGLRQLTDLLDEAREASAAGTRLIVSGAPAPLDPGVERAAYRIVQEALTNARRHAPGAAVDVELRYTEDALLLRIRDNGPGTAPGADGHGLLGMRERAAAVGGDLRAGPAAGNGFLVAATLPIGEAVR